MIAQKSVAVCRLLQRTESCTTLTSMIHSDPCRDRYRANGITRRPAYLLLLGVLVAHCALTAAGRQAYFLRARSELVPLWKTLLRTNVVTAGDHLWNRLK
jgi:hypothetical protein